MTGEFAIAVHALVFLNHKQTTLSSEALAENICTNAARVRKVMSMLKKAGLVATKEGVDGGYQFIQQPEQVTLRCVCEAVDGRLVGAAWRSGDMDKECLVASGMGDIMQHIYDHLDDICRQNLEELTIADIDRKIFGGIGKGEWLLSDPYRR